MKKLCLLLLVLSTLVSRADAQIEINENFEEEVERFADKVELLAERIASRAEDLAERFEDGDTRLQVNLRSPIQKARLGVQLKDIPLEKARRLGFENVYGSMIVRVYPQTPAEEAGLEAFDYLIGINGEYVSERRSFSDLMEEYEPGDRIQVHFIRGGKEQHVEVQLDDAGRIGYVFSNQQFVWLGVSPAIQELAEDYDGVSVRVNRNSPAARMGLQDGDVIKEIDGKPILEWDDLRIALNTIEADREVTIVYERGGELHTTSGKLGSRFGNMRIEVPEVIIEPEDFRIEIPEEIEIEDVEELDDDLYWQETDKPFIGVYVEEISKEKASRLGIDNPYGIYVTGIVPGSAAEKAGLKPFDYIYGVDQFRVGEEQSLAAILKRYKPGYSAVLHIYRQGKKKEVKITFGKPEMKKEEAKPSNDCEDPFFGIIQEYKGEVTEGIPVSVVKGSTAEESGLKKGDVLLAINGNKMVDWDDVKIAINSIRPGEKIQVEYSRNGEKRTGTAVMKSLAETKNCENCDCGDEADIVVKVGEAPNIKLKFKDVIVDEKQPERRPSLDNINMKVEDAAESIDRLKAAGLIAGNVTAGLNLSGFQLKADASSGKFEFGFDLPSSGDLEIKVADQNNKVIYEAELIDYSGRFDDSLDLAQKVPAVYTIIVVQNGKAAIKRVSLD
ncbi:MAG: hypothetical protein Kow0027_00560 [Saprospiraceae bacterium]